LFAKSVYEAGDNIAFYHGDLISIEAYNKRVSEGNGGYALQITNNVMLDCYRSTMNGQCLASLANSSTNAFVVRKNEFVPAPAPNATIVIHRGNKTAYLRALRNIQCNDEILTSYSKSYIYPN
jgi:hypothetical protein